MESADTPTILLLDLPNSALAGIDLLSFTSTPRFRGVKNLPRGFHFAFVGSSIAFSERHGVWFFIAQSDTRNSGLGLVVTKWQSNSEDLVVETDSAEVLRWRANLGSIWKEGLTPYRQATQTGAETNDLEESNDWPILTSSITNKLLARITGHEDIWKLSSASSTREDLDAIPGLSNEDLNLESESQLHLLPINLKHTWREGATGRERTDAAQDRSWALNNLVQTVCTDGDASEIVGELQFCFLMVLTLNNFSCFEQWKRILSLVLTCKETVPWRPEFFISTIAALRLQLQHCKDAEGGLIDLADEGGSLLKTLLNRFRKGLEALGGIEVSDVLDELEDLEDYLKDQFGWQFGGSFVKSGMLELEDGEQVRMDTTAFDEDDESGEFAPQLVELTAEQAKMLGIEDDADVLTTLKRTSLKDRHPVESEDEEETESVSSNESLEELELDEMDARY